MTSVGRTIIALPLGIIVVASILLLAAPSVFARVDGSSVRSATLLLCEGSQNGSMTLQEAIWCVRSQGNVDRILQAETRVESGRAVHYIKVLTTNQKIRTYKIPGRTGGPDTPLFGVEAPNHSATYERLVLADFRPLHYLICDIRVAAPDWR